MISCTHDLKKFEVKIEGNSAVVCMETEDLLRAVREALAKKFGDEDSKDMMNLIFENSLLTAEESAKKAEAEMNDDNSNESFEKILSGLDEFFSDFKDFVEKKRERGNDLLTK